MQCFYSTCVNWASGLKHSQGSEHFPPPVNGDCPFHSPLHHHGPQHQDADHQHGHHDPQHGDLHQHPPAGAAGAAGAGGAGAAAAGAAAAEILIFFSISINI